MEWIICKNQYKVASFAIFISITLLEHTRVSKLFSKCKKKKKIFGIRKLFFIKNYDGYAHLYTWSAGTF